jgi:periplasmic protein TonB
MRKDRARLFIGASVSLAVHGLLFAAVPSWIDSAEELAGETGEVSIEVIALEPEQVREILEPEVRRSMPSLLEAKPRHRSPEILEPPRSLSIERPREIVETRRAPDLALPPIDSPETTISELDLLRPDPVEPVVEVTPEVAEAAPVPAVNRSTAPPRLEDLSGLVVHREPLSYPLSAQRRGIEGVASIAVEVDAAGLVVRTEILRSSGNRILDRAARKNLMRWRFDPVAVAAAGWGNVFRQDVFFQID